MKYKKKRFFFLKFKGLINDISYIFGFPGDLVEKNLPATAGDVGSIPGRGRSPGGGNDTPLQYFCLGKIP